MTTAGAAGIDYNFSGKGKILSIKKDYRINFKSKRININREELDLDEGD